MLTEELQLSGPMGGVEHLQEQPAEQAREHAHRQEEVGPARHPALAVERDAAARHDHVDVRMMGERRAPGVQHRGDADAGAEMLGIGRDRQHGLGRRLEQQVVDHGLVLIGDVGDRRRQREHDMIIRHRQQLGFAFGQPFPGRGALALRAMPVAATVVGDDGVGAVLAARDMAAERRRAAALDRGHHLQLIEAHVAGIGATPRRSVIAEDIRDLQRCSRTWPQALRRRAVPSCVLARLRQQVERALDVGDHAGGDARVARRRVQLVVAQQRLDHSDIGAAFQQMGGEAVTQRVQRHALLDPGGIGGFMEQPAQLARGQRLAGRAAGKQPAFLQRRLAHRDALGAPSTIAAADRASPATA